MSEKIWSMAQKMQKGAPFSGGKRQRNRHREEKFIKSGKQDA